MSYDVKCYELAEHFLSDQLVPPASEDLKAELAQLIQNVIEDYLREMEGK